MICQMRKERSDMTDKLVLKVETGKDKELLDFLN